MARRLIPSVLVLGGAIFRVGPVLAAFLVIASGAEERSLFRQVRHHPDAENCGYRTATVGGQAVRYPNAARYERTCEAGSYFADHYGDPRCGAWTFVRCHGEPDAQNAQLSR